MADITSKGLLIRDRVLQATDSGTVIFRGLKRDSTGRLVVRTDVPGSSAVYESGIARTDGEVHITNAALGSGAVIEGGVGITGGRLHVRDDSPGTSAIYRNGLAYTENRLHLSYESFNLPLSDLGSGEVDTTLTNGTGSATFTRATTGTLLGS
jgi:hypothetical protein